MKKNGFTLVELSIAILVVGVLAGVLIPIIASITPDRENVMVKKAYNNLEQTITYLINDIDLFPDQTSGFASPADSSKTFCYYLTNNLNVLAQSTGTPNSECNFTTTDGINWQVSPYKFTNSSTIVTVTFTPPKSSTTYPVTLSALGRISVTDTNFANILSHPLKNGDK